MDNSPKSYHLTAFELLNQLLYINFPSFKDLRGWQFLTMKAAGTLCIVCLPPEDTFPEKNIWLPAFQKITFYKGLTIKFASLRIL